MNRGTWAWAPTAVAAAARRSIADPAQLLVPAGFYVLVVAVLGSLWRAAAEQGGGTLAGYAAGALVWYIAGSEAATVALDLRMIERTGEDIASGAVVVELLRPVSTLGMRIATELGRSLPRLAFCIVAGTLFGLVTTGGIPSLPAAALAVPALLLAVTCNTLAQHAFAAASFWVRDARSAWFLYQKLVFLLGGMLIPIEVFPSWLQTAARALPFVAMSYVPARLLAGFFEPWLLALQLGWLVVLGVAAAAAFAAGERRVQAVGG